MSILLYPCKGGHLHFAAIYGEETNEETAYVGAPFVSIVQGVCLLTALFQNQQVGFYEYHMLLDDIMWCGEDSESPKGLLSLQHHVTAWEQRLPDIWEDLISSSPRKRRLSPKMRSKLLSLRCDFLQASDPAGSTVDFHDLEHVANLLLARQEYDKIMAAGSFPALLH